MRVISYIRTLLHKEPFTNKNIKFRAIYSYVPIYMFQIRINNQIRVQRS